MDKLGTKRKEIRHPERMAPGFSQDIPIFTIPPYIDLHSNRGTYRYFQLPTGGCTRKEQQGKSVLKENAGIVWSFRRSFQTIGWVGDFGFQS